MLATWVIEALRCPETGQRLRREAGGWRRCSDGHVYADQEGISSLPFPVQLPQADARMHRRYERLAPFYDRSERWLAWLLTGVDMRRTRLEMVELLGLRPGMRLLEVSPGPGVLLPALRSRLGPQAELAALDLSLGMLLQCRRRMGCLGVELIRGNGHHLPFADASFDVLFHFGGIQLFADPDQALVEWLRVLRPGGLIAWGDEAMSPDFKHPIGRWVLPCLNPGFGCRAPAAPAGLADLSRHEVHGGLGYLMVGRKASGLPIAPKEIKEYFHG